MTDPTEPLFHRDGDWYRPTAYTTGPWRPDAMHGGATSALLAMALERAVEPDEQLARVNIDLQRPVPLEPLNPKVVRREVSRRVAHLEVELHTGTAMVASVLAVVLRGAVVSPDMVHGFDDVVEVPGPELTMDTPGAAHDSPILYHRDTIEHRFVRGGLGISGPATSWQRLRCAVVGGEESSGLSQLFAVADFGSAISQHVVPGTGAGMINVDVSVALGRVPVGPWIGLDGVGGVNERGIGLAVTELRDRCGRVGVATQNQLSYAYPV